MVELPYYRFLDHLLMHYVIQYEHYQFLSPYRYFLHHQYDIKVEYYDQNAKYNLDHIKGFQAIVYQHEIDHLDGILFTDKVKDKKSLVTYENYIKYYEEDYRLELMKLANY